MGARESERESLTRACPEGLKRDRETERDRARERASSSDFRESV